MPARVRARRHGTRSRHRTAARCQSRQAPVTAFMALTSVSQTDGARRGGVTCGTIWRWLDTCRRAVEGCAHNGRDPAHRRLRRVRRRTAAWLHRLRLRPRGGATAQPGAATGQGGAIRRDVAGDRRRCRIASGLAVVRLARGTRTEPGAGAGHTDRRRDTDRIPRRCGAVRDRRRDPCVRSAAMARISPAAASIARC